MKKDLAHIIVAFLKQEIKGIFAIYLYGSRADETANSESDVDIAFLTEEKIKAVEKWEIQEKLAAKLDTDVDLVNLQDASVVLRKEIIDKGKLIFSSNKFQVDSFEMTSYSMYMDLNETRKNILNDYHEKYGRHSD